MTYKQLLEFIENMSAEQQKMDAIFATQEENHIISMVSQVLHNDDTDTTALPVGQPILS